MKLFITSSVFTRSDSAIDAAVPSPERIDVFTLPETPLFQRK